MTTKVIILAAAVIAGGFCFAQFRSGTPGNLVRLEGGLMVNEDEIQTARETDTHSSGTPNWTNSAGFEPDVFTFARVIFKSDPGPRSRSGRFRWLGWWVDYPDADLNFSYRLQQLSTIRTDPDARVLKFTDPKLSDYPLLYIEHAGYMRLTDDEIVALRKYLLNGGALLVNDFWGSEEWNGFASEVKRVLPDRAWTDLTTDHPVFHCVYDLRGPMGKFQVPTIQFWNRDYDPHNPRSPQQTMFRGEGSEEMHVRAVFDDQKRMMILAIHNSDVSDGWEREGENELYFKQYSERVAYPLGINIVFYLMTH
jgi:hypothetical protein